MRCRRCRTVAAGIVVVAGLVFPPLPAGAAGANPNETVDTTMAAAALAQTLVGPGVAIENVVYTGAPDARGTFAFSDAAVLGMSEGVVLSSGNAHDVVGPNTSDSFSTDWTNPGDADLDGLSGFPTFDAAVLEFDFTPTANQVSFQYAFASDEYSEWVNTPYNDVFAFFINGVNCAEVRQVAGDPTAIFVPVAVNNINDSNPVQDPPPTPMRPDLYRANAFDPNAPSVVDLEMDGITRVISCQSAVNPGVVNHMKLAIADASDPIYDSAVFIQAGSLVSNENPVADLGLDPSTGAAPLDVTATVEAEDPNDLPLTYTIDWGDGTSTGGQALPDLTATATHTYVYAGKYIVTLTVSNGTLSGTDQDDVEVSGASTTSTTAASTTTTTAASTTTTTTTASTTTTTAVSTTSTTGIEPTTTTTTEPPTTTEPTTTTITTTTSSTTTTTQPPLCPAAPVAGCRLTQPNASTLRLKDEPTDARDELKWEWAKGAATTLTDLGNPLVDSAYRLCIYDAAATEQPRLALRVPAGGTCGRSPCWKATKKGYAYASRAGTPDGITNVKLEAGVVGKARVIVAGKGVNLPMPVLGLGLPVTVQLVREDAGAPTCWQTTFTTAAKDDVAQFTAKGP